VCGFILSELLNLQATELQRWKLEEERKYEEAKQAEEAALAIAEKEKAKSKAALEAAEAAQRIAEMESKKRSSAEMKALKETEEKRKAWWLFRCCITTLSLFALLAEMALLQNHCLSALFIFFLSRCLNRTITPMGLFPVVLWTEISGEIVNEDLQVSLIG